ncbi:CSC1-like protein At3g54510 [Actinidia eriantha]|uniref:CSC1-like protein At3g54510 n=1 Tax=Actinidia eriantha TaxID=165200 RepID=UPI00258304DA|nr:CSC1-like protein At3g54510 [Actinidia eriantha]
MTGLNLEAIGEWHNYFESTGLDVFNVIENAIKVAVWYRPDDFLMRRDEIAQLLFKKQSVRPNKDTRVYSGVMNRDKTLDSSSASSSKTLSAEDDFYSLKEQSAKKIINQGKEFSNFEDVQINKPVEITSPKLNREAKAEEQPKSTMESTSCTAAEIFKHEEDNFSSTREEQNPNAKKIIKINLSELRNREKRFQNFEDVESGVSKSPIPSVRSEVCDEAELTKNLVSGPWDESVAVTRKTELLETSSDGKLVPNLEKDVQNATERSLKQIPESKISKKGKVQEHLIQPKPSNKGEEALELKLEATKRKLHEGYDQVQNARKKIQLIGELPRPLPVEAKTKKTRNPIRYNIRMPVVHKGFIPNKMRKRTNTPFRFVRYDYSVAADEYDDILTKRIQQLCNNRHRSDQFTVLVREIPLCEEHKAHGCCVEHFFSKYHPYSYRSYQILYDGKDLDELLKEAKHLARKIKSLRHQSLTKKCNKEYSLSDSYGQDAKVVQYEERLEELCQKISYIQCKKMLEQKELPVAFVTFRTRWGAALAAQSQQHSNPLLWITEMAPEPRDVLWRNLAIPYRHLPLYKIGVFVAASLLTIFFAIPVTAIQGIAKFERLRKWFPPAMAVQMIPGFGPVITGYLPSAILSGFIYIIPFAMLAMAKLAGYVSRSKKDIKASNMVFYFLVGNVFFLSLLSGSLIDQIGESFTHPKDFPSRLASAVSAQADFFMTYILTNGLAGFSLEILQPGLLIWDTIKSYTWGHGKDKHLYLYSLPYYRVIPFVSVSIIIGMVYAVVAPLLLPFLIGYFFLGYIVFITQIEDVYETIYETCGQYWPYIHHYIFLAIVLTQITMIGLFGLKSKPSASFATIPLLVLTIMFNEYCKIRFLPTFCRYPLKDAMTNDDLDEKSGLMETNYQKALDAYCPPCLRPVNFTAEEPNSSQPLIS